MMKKLMVFLVFLFLVPAALAEDAAPYTPGAATKALFAEAFNRGDMLLASMDLDVTFNENAADVFGEDSALLDALSEALRSASLTAGLSRLDDGVRILLAGQYEKEGQAADLDLTLDLTEQGMSLMSSAIPGERLIADWATLLTLCGMSPEEAEQLLSLRKTDMEALLVQLLQEIQPVLELTEQIAAPYGETILAHIAALPIEVLEDVPAEAGFPAAAAEINVAISAKALGDLIIALCDQLAADTTLCAILDASLAQEGITTAELCHAIRNSAAETMTDESMPLTVCLGMDEASNFLYISAMIESTEGGSVIFCAINAPAEENPALMRFTLDLLAATPENNVSDGVSLEVYYPQTATQMLEVQGNAYLFAEGEVLCDTSFGFDKMPTVTENGLRGEALGSSLLLNAYDAEDIFSASVDANLQQGETAGGGEQSAFSCSVTLALGDMQHPLTVDVSTLTENTEDGPTAALTSIVKAPMLGVSEYIESYTIYTAAYTPDLSTVTDISLATASSEDLEALAGRAMASLQQTAAVLFGMLPQALIAEF